MEKLVMQVEEKSTSAEIEKNFILCVGCLFYGRFTSEKDAKEHLKTHFPNAKPFEGNPYEIKSLPENAYFITYRPPKKLK